MSNYIFRYNIETKYGAYILKLYKQIKGLPDAEYNYICSFKRTELLDYHNWDTELIKKFLKDNQIDFIGLDDNVMWAGIKTKDDLNTINLLLPLMCKFKIHKIIKVSLLEKYKLACNKYQNQQYIQFKKYKLDKGIIEHDKQTKS